MTQTEPARLPVIAWQEDLSNGTLPYRALSDPELHSRELERIFAKSWLAVGFESEIPNAGDYMLRTLATDQVIVSRSDDGSINVLLNNCRHRGTWLCQEERGNAKTFKCPYHGWAYRNDGSWAGAPMRSKAYRTLDPDKWGLLRAKVELRWGIIFATLDPDATTFVDYLGDFLFFADAFLGLDSHGLRPLGEPNKWRARSNWKSSQENFTGDSYHFSTLHASAVEVGVVQGIGPVQDHFAMFHTDNGHGVMCWGLKDAGMALPDSKPFLYPENVWNGFDKRGLSDEQLAWVDKYPPLTMIIFPNVGFLRLPAFNTETGQLVPYTAVRILEPLSASETISWNFTTLYNVESAENIAAAAQAALHWVGAAGAGDIDDALSWEGAASAADSLFARTRNMSINLQMGLGDMSVARPVEGWDGPGVACTTVYNDNNQRAFYSEWIKRMDESAVQG